jgi:hypothetical protein
LQAEAEDLWAGLRDKTKNLIRRACERLTVRDIEDVNLFVSKENLEGAESYFDLSFLAPVYATAQHHHQPTYSDARPWALNRNGRAKAISVARPPGPAIADMLAYGLRAGARW